MSRVISERFVKLRSSGRKALIPYLTCGFPSQRRFVEYARLLEDQGADMLEIGLPHSDPLADGPTIRRTSHQVLSRGLKIDRAFSLIGRVASATSLPLIIMCYVNTIMKPGMRKFAARCKAHSVTGIIVPDLIYEEGDRLSSCMREREIDIIYLAAPTTPVNRVREIANASSGYLYLVSVTGVTGARGSLPQSTAAFISRAKAVSPIPVCVGFGISGEAIARQMGRLADGIIVGSALLDRIITARSKTGAVRSVSSLMKELRRGLDR